MKAMNAHIIIGDYELNYVHQVTVESSWNTLADMATIELPNIQGQLDKQFKVGQEVIVRLGYDGALTEDFRGYVSSISMTSPVRIECMDEMWRLRQETISESWKSISLEEVVRFIAPTAIVSVPDVQLKPFRLDRVTRAEALEVIRDQYGLAVFFRGPELYVGLPYAIDEEPFEHFYHFQKNVASYGDLTFRTEDDVKVKVKAISVKPDNTRIEVDLGDADGELRTLHFYNLTEAELRKQAQEKLKLLKYNGYQGSFEAFGFPNAQHSGIADITDANYPQRGGRYFIDAVAINYGPGGYRRTLTLGRKA